MKEQILEFDRLIRAWHRSNEMSMRLEAAPGVGPVRATALVAAVADPKSFQSGRNFSAWIGMVPKQHSSGGKQRLGNISKQGDRYLRGLFVAGALSVIRYAKIRGLTGAAADQGCSHRPRQQDRADGLGHDGQGRAIRGTGCACAMNEISPEIRRDVKVGRANST
jgi:transposase